MLQALPDNAGLGGGAVSHFEPQVALLCDAGVHGQEVYHPQYMTEQGRWQTDLTSKASCLKDKMDILDYCKKVRLTSETYEIVCSYESTSIDVCIIVVSIGIIMLRHMAVLH